MRMSIPLRRVTFTDFPNVVHSLPQRVKPNQRQEMVLTQSVWKDAVAFLGFHGVIYSTSTAKQKEL